MVQRTPRSPAPGGRYPLIQTLDAFFTQRPLHQPQPSEVSDTELLLIYLAAEGYVVEPFDWT